MIRSALVLAVVLGWLSPLSATLTPAPRPGVTSKETLTNLAKQPRPSAGPQEYVLTSTTEIKLDGQPCRYEDIPANAEVTVLEVGADHRTILKMHFRRKK
jgi:hypothetical protein